jgi:hypothetical protein
MLPVSTNLWIHSELFRDGWRYEEALGPQDINRVWGD